MAKKVHGDELTLAQLQTRVAKAKASLAGIRALFTEAQELPKTDRSESSGKMGLEESAALVSVVGAVDVAPTVFQVLADEDAGHDPDRVETDLIRDRFARHDLYRELADEMLATAKVFSDTALSFGALVKPFARAVYEIAKPISKHNAAIRAKLALALDYYGGNAQLAAAAKQAKKAAKPTS